jgi:hypothetical protein
MILKIFKAVWFISLLAVIANLLYVYVGWPQDVVIFENVSDIFLVDRENLFYSAMSVLAVFNLLVFVFSRGVAPDEGFRSWMHGFVITLNIFSIISLSFISLYNSSEKFDFSRIGVIIYSSIGLVVLWAISWPLIAIARKLFSKQKV